MRCEELGTEAKMAKYLVTGGAGFFGGILKNKLLADGAEVVSIDLVPDTTKHQALTSIHADIRNEQSMRSIFAAHQFDAVFHIAAMLAHGKMSRELQRGRNQSSRRVRAPGRRKEAGIHLKQLSLGQQYGASGARRRPAGASGVVRRVKARR